MNKTKIEWADMTWNPVTGCLHGCDYCYARKIAERFAERLDDGSVAILPGAGIVEIGESNIPYPYGFAPTFHRHRLSEPQKVKKPQNIFVCSMADLFGDWVPDSWINQVFEACEAAPQHNYLFLTKNPKKVSKMCFNGLPLNHWYGQTITSGEVFGMPMADHSFISFEPLMSDVVISPLVYFGWAIIGAETGNRKDKVVPKREWVETIVEFCRKKNIPVFMKDSLKEIMGNDFVQELPEELK